MNSYSVLRHHEESYRCPMDHEVDSEDSTRLLDTIETIDCSGSHENQGMTATFQCCPGCEVLNEPVTELVPIEEDHPIVLPRNNQGQAMRIGAVCTGQCAH